MTPQSRQELAAQLMALQQLVELRFQHDGNIHWQLGDTLNAIRKRIISESPEAAFAVLLLTSEDETAYGMKRARQNVVHEIGLFQGRLGFRRVVLLKQEGIEEFSNVAGLQYISFEGDKIEGAFYELQRVLQREGIVTQ